MADRPAADWPTSPVIARELLAAIGIVAPLCPLGEGWDNTLYRIDTPVRPRVLRLPRRQASVPLIRHEQRWLPALGPHLPHPIPVPEHIGAPTASFPAPWSVLPWFSGRTGHVDDDGSIGLATDLAHFLRALHRPAPPKAPHNPLRGIPLVERGKRTWAALEVLRDELGRPTVDALWATYLELAHGPRHDQPPVWLHGDLHPDNLLVADGRLSAVIDWGDICQGDPASDLAIAWMRFDGPARARFFDTYQPDAHLQQRARGWAIALGAVFASTSDDDPAFHAMALRALARA